MKKNEISRSGYLILKEKHLIIDVFAGALTLESYKSHKLTQSLDADYSQDYNLFVDMRSVKVIGVLHQVAEYIDYVAKIGNRIGNRNTAVLVATHNQKIYANEFIELKHKLKQDLRIFTEMEPAVKWVSDDLTTDDMEKVIRDIRDNPPFIFYSESGY